MNVPPQQLVERSKEAVEGASESTVIHQVSEFPVRAEDRTLVNCREINNWRDRCLQFKMSVLSEDNWAGVFLGLGAGFIVSAIAGTGGKHGWGLAMLGGVCLLVAAALGSIAYSKRDKQKHDLSMLAAEMENARDANRVMQKEPTRI